MLKCSITFSQADHLEISWLLLHNKQAQNLSGTIVYLAYASGSWLGLVWLRLGLSQLGWRTFPQVSLIFHLGLVSQTLQAFLMVMAEVPGICYSFRFLLKGLWPILIMVHFYARSYARTLCKPTCVNAFQTSAVSRWPTWLNKTSHVVRCNVKAAEKYISLMDWGKGSEYLTVIQSRYFIYIKFLPGKKWKTPKLLNWISLY